MMFKQEMIALGLALMLLWVANPLHAEPNCDKANLGANDQGHIRGNSHCSTGVEPKEPARDCGHKNSEKDNDADGATICINRG
jgi:hypothetical protein